MRIIALGLIRFYQLTLSKWLPSQCRFTPSCSQYGLDAIRQHGSWRGGWLTVWRIARCNPRSKGGYDPVPKTYTTMGRKWPFLLIAAGYVAILSAAYRIGRKARPIRR